MKFSRLLFGTLVMVSAASSFAETQESSKLRFGRSVDRDGAMIYVAQKKMPGNQGGPLRVTVNIGPLLSLDIQKGDVIPLNSREFYRVEDIVVGSRENEKSEMSPIPSGGGERGYILLKKLSLDPDTLPQGKILWITAPSSSIGIGNRPTMDEQIVCTLSEIDNKEHSIELYWRAETYPESLSKLNDQASGGTTRNLQGKIHAKIGEKFNIPYVGSFVLKAIVEPSENGHFWAALESN